MRLKIYFDNQGKGLNFIFIHLLIPIKYIVVNMDAVVCVCLYIYIYTHTHTHGLFKSSQPYQESKAIAEHLHCDHTLSLLIKQEKLNQVFFLVS